MTRDTWVFTFGAGHAFVNQYVTIAGEYLNARMIMFDHFGYKWCEQYSNKIGMEVVKEYGLSFLPESEWPRPGDPNHI